MDGLYRQAEDLVPLSQWSPAFDAHSLARIGPWMAASMPPGMVGH